MEQIKRYLDEILTNSTPEQPVWNQEALLENKPAGWSYIDGCMLIAVLYMYEATRDQKYYRFLHDFVDYYIADDGTILGYDFEAMNSDSINEGKVLLTLYQETKQEKYYKAMKQLHEQIRQQPRTKSGSLWHKKVYPNQVWLDGLYMVQPFYIQYELNFNAGRNIEDIMTQFENVDQLMKDEETGLFYHGYDEKRKAFWADPVTGCSANFWTRSLGWYAMALVDTLELMGDEFPEEYELLMIYLNELIEAVLQFEEQETDLFYQVTVEGDRLGNYLETSGSCALAYTLMKGARIEALPESYFNKGQAILKSVVDHKLVMEDGHLVLKDICLVAGLGGMPGKGDYKLRDGSYEYYISEPIVKDDAKGIGPLVYAYSEYLRRHSPIYV